MTDHRPKLVCFDWGGVILRICQDFDQARARAGLDDRPINSSTDKVVRRKQIVHAYETGAASCDAYFSAMSETIDGVYSPADLGTIHDAWLIEEFAGAAELIEDLHDLGVQTALLSNTNARHWIRQAESDHGQAFPIAARLGHTHASHLLGHAKPDIEAFRAFESSTGFSPDEIVFFDDRPGNIEGATAAGWRAEPVDPTLDPPARIRELLAPLWFIEH